MQISMDKKYKTRDGHEVKIYSVEGNANGHIHGAILLKSGEWELHSWRKEGRIWLTGDSSLDLIEAKERLEKIERWANVYRDRTVAVHSSKEKADINRHTSCFACVKITIDCEEGEGL